MRTGLIGQKIGMSCIFSQDGKRVPVTVLQVTGNQVVGHRLQEKHGYNAVMIGCKNVKATKLNKSERGFFAKVGIDAKVKLKEFRVSSKGLLGIGEFLGVNHFAVGQYIDISSVSIGKGFAGVMKRHNFRGLEASHGVSISHRSHGSTGGRQDPGRVFKNKKMAGHMGSKKITVQNLRVVMLDESKELLFVSGSVPGSKGSFVCIQDAIKKQSVIF